MEEEKLSWNAEKKLLWKEKAPVLMEKLQELETNRMKLETKMMTKAGSSMSVRNYPTEKYIGKFGNIRLIKKQIACVKTMLHVKMLNKSKS